MKYTFCQTPSKRKCTIKNYLVFVAEAGAFYQRRKFASLESARKWCKLQDSETEIRDSGNHLLDLFRKGQSLLNDVTPQVVEQAHHDEQVRRLKEEYRQFKHNKRQQTT